MVQRTVINSVARPVLVDVGANVGTWTARVLELLDKKDGLVLAFEPDSGAMRALQSRLGGDPRVRLIEKAVGSAGGRIDFHVRQEAAGTNTVVDMQGYEPCLRTVPVAMTSLPDAFREYGIAHAHLVKTDAEGFDFEILKGARPLFEQGRISVVQFEYNHRWIFSRTYLLDVFRLLHGLPYVLGKVAGAHMEVYERWHPELERYFECNYVCLHKDAQSWFSCRSVRWDGNNTLAPVA
jgi:FkbM family methyltransferase